jgi:hypothetical protein
MPTCRLPHHRRCPPGVGRSQESGRPEIARPIIPTTETNRRVDFLTPRFAEPSCFFAAFSVLLLTKICRAVRSGMRFAEYNFPRSAGFLEGERRLLWNADSAAILSAGRGSGRLGRFWGAGSLCDQLGDGTQKSSGCANLGLGTVREYKLDSSTGSFRRRTSGLSAPALGAPNSTPTAPSLTSNC